MFDNTSDLSTCVFFSLHSFVVISSLTQSQLSCFSHDRVTWLKCQYLGRLHRMRQPAVVANAIRVRGDTCIQRRTSMHEDYTTRGFNWQFEDFVVACLVELIAMLSCKTLFLFASRSSSLLQY